MGLLQLLAILWARRSVVLGCFISTVFLAVGITLVLPKSYEAKVTVLVDNEARNAYTNDFDSRISVTEFLGKQIAIVKSERTAHMVIKDLRLDQNPRFKREFFSQHRKVNMADWIAARLIKSLQVVTLPTESSIQITFRSPDADASATISNAFADAYMRTDTDIRMDTAQQTASRLKEQARHLQKELLDAERALREYQTRSGLVVADGDLDSEMKKLDALQKLQTETSTATENARVQLNAFRNAKAKGLSLDELAGLSANPIPVGLRSQMADLNASLAEIKGRFGIRHPDYVAGAAKFGALQKEVRDALDREERSLALAVTSGEQKIIDLEKAITDQKTQVVQLQTHWDEYQTYWNQVKTKRAEVEQTVTRSGAEAIESRVSALTALILSPAVPPADPSFPNLYLNAGLAIIFGVFFGLVMSVLVELFDRRIRSPEDFEDAAGAHVIVVVPKRA